MHDVCMDIKCMVEGLWFLGSMLCSFGYARVMAQLRGRGADDPFRARLPMFIRPGSGNPSNTQLCSMISDT